MAEKDDTQRDDATDSPVDDETAKVAARRLAAKSKNQEDPDPDDADPDDETDDEAVSRWLDEVVRTPEIQSVIKSAAREIAKESTADVKKIREDLEADFNKRLAKVESRFRDGSLDREEADEQAAAAVAAAARAAGAKSDDKSDAEADKLQRVQDEREAKLRRRELENYRQEVLRGEDSNKLLPELVTITADDDEDSIDSKIENSKKQYITIRKRIIADLRSLGWKSPQDLKRLADEVDVDTSDDEDPDDEGPPTRDRSVTRGLSNGRKKSLRDRFRYGPNEPAARR